MSADQSGGVPVKRTMTEWEKVSAFTRRAHHLRLTIEEKGDLDCVNEYLEESTTRKYNTHTLDDFPAGTVFEIEKMVSCDEGIGGSIFFFFRTHVKPSPVEMMEAASCPEWQKIEGVIQFHDQRECVGLKDHAMPCIAIKDLCVRRRVLLVVEKGVPLAFRDAEDLVTCEFCGNRWDGNAQCRCDHLCPGCSEDAFSCGCEVVEDKE